MTPYELGVRVKIYNEDVIEKSIEKAREIVTNAYYIEAFHRIDKLKELSYYLDELEDNYKKVVKKESNIQTQDQMLNQIQVLNALYGGKVVYI